jgi:hypothetical protein
MAKKIDYNARNFSDVRQQLIEFIQKYYPEIFSDFNDASVGMMLIGIKRCGWGYVIFPYR